MERITAAGMSMPKLGLGTFRMTGPACTEAVQRALGLGYRHLDTAEMYGNEAEVGEGLAAGGVKRSEVHLTTKVWWENLAGDGIARAIERSLSKLRTDYVDLYLIHWPSRDMDLGEAMDALLAVKERGQARAIGVSNFPVALFRRATEEIGASLACNQFENHVLIGQERLVAATRTAGAAAVAYVPLAQGRLAEHQSLRRIADKHGASPAQVALKWLLDQDGVAAIPKAGREQSQRDNLEALSLQLDDEDRAGIAALPKDHRFVNPPFAPSWDPVG